MRGSTVRVATTRSRREPGGRAAAAALLLIFCAVASTRAASTPAASSQSGGALDDMQRREGEALLRLTDEAMSGRAASDFSIAWSNDFFKAQTGTFVPFTLTIARSAMTAPAALMYIRAARRNALPAASTVSYPFDIVFSVPLEASAGQPIRITRGFAVAPGEYDVYVALRERASNPRRSDRRLKCAVIKQPLSVPDFWTGQLAMSTVMLADRIDRVPAPVSGDDVLERPYVIGASEVHKAIGTSFRHDRELIVVFLIYNPTVSTEKRFDVEVSYHLFRRNAGATDVDADRDHPAAEPGEAYVTRTPPQRFQPELMGPDFDPVSGPILAGQGILLSSFEAGEYRLGITVTDRLSRQALTRNVVFKVVGS